MSKKQGVKKGSTQAATFAQRKQDEKTMWTVKVIAYMQQEVLDTVALVLADGFGFGEDRQARFRYLFDAKYAEIKELEKADTADNEYTIAKTEEALKRACGRHYVPREQRYDFSMRTPDGREVKL